MNLDGAPAPHVIIDFDKPGALLGESETRCDYLFIADGADDVPEWVVPMELSGGRNKKSGQTLAQLQAGAKVACKILPPNIIPKFQLVFVGSIGNSYLRKDIKKKKISFRGQSEITEAISCGDPLTKALKITPPQKEAH